MPENRRQKHELIWMLVSGVCVGCLAGLSVSPVVAGLLASVTAVVVVLTTALAGLSVEPAATEAGGAPSRGVRVDPRPVALLLMGILLGAVLGILTRTHDLLGDPARSKTGPGSNSAAAGQEKKDFGNPAAGVLYADQVKACPGLRATQDLNALRDALSRSDMVVKTPGALDIVKGCNDMACLRGEVRSLCGE